uniref:Uncharacterized protein AlNc14C156G7659 n=1 Tax=Albugo laibachii Nc14 TaxID=890382 RepID=F0WMG9_9STRA|nr:conserved hypothetical protein [Albugo laibachii Nc14]|eukprot:CCA22501.1 conserved hypothetical protein [Albugo laibachii Nc14]
MFATSRTTYADSNESHICFDDQLTFLAQSINSDRMMECLRLWNLRSQNSGDANDALQHVTSQRLFLSVVLEWQLAKAQQKHFHEGHPHHAEGRFYPHPSRFAHSLAKKENRSRDTFHHEKVKYIGIYSPRARQKLLAKYMRKREKRLLQKTVRYGVRKALANARPRIKGRFVKTTTSVTAATLQDVEDLDSSE